jgi:hypothetical protein
MFNTHKLGRPSEDYNERELDALSRANSKIFENYIEEALSEGVSPIELSILKWELVREGYFDGTYGSTCALCSKYYNYFSEIDGSCDTCPIRKKTEQRYCRGTPYSDYIFSNTDEYEVAFPDKDLLQIIDREIDFLKELRREENRHDTDC